MSKYTIGIDLGGTTMTAGLVNEKFEVVGKVTTNRAANVREKPSSSAKVVRQLSQGNKLNVLGRYEGADGEIWYEVVTTSGKTYGFVRDYVVYVTEMDRDLETQTYTP